MSTPSWYVRKIKQPLWSWSKPLSGPDVEHLQLALGAPLTGVYDEATEQRVRGVQQALGLKVTGVVDADTATAIHRLTTREEPDVG